MNERTYTGTQATTGGNTYGQQSQQGGGILHFIIGLISGIVVTAPVTTLIVKKVCDNNKQKEVQAAYNRGADAGMQAMAQVAKEEMAKVVAANASLSPSKAPRSVSEPSNDQEVEEGSTEAPEGHSEETEACCDTQSSKSNEITFNTFTHSYSLLEDFDPEELMDEVDRELLMDGITEDTLKKMKEAYLDNRNDTLSSIFSRDGNERTAGFLAHTYQMALHNKALDKRHEYLQKVAEKAKEKIDNAAKNAGVPQEETERQAAVPTYSEPEVVNMVEKDYSSQFATGSGTRSGFATYDGVNSYLRGTIEDPESRAEFERKMAETMGPPDDEDINNYDLRIDDEEATQEAREFSESRVEYLEMIRKYKDVNGDIPPMTISEEQFENEHFLEKNYINWYEVDDVFEENDAKIDDPYYHFGFVTGRDMFSPDRVALREDPDICHVRNLKESTDYEITRVHGSYSQMIEDGEVYYRGETNPQY